MEKTFAHFARISLLRASFLAAIAVFSGCSVPVTKNAVQSFDIMKAGLEPGKVIDRVTGILVDRGFDIKLTNKDAGLVTTEYKKFAAAGENPPFDYYMQIKAKVKVRGPEVTIQLSPIVKEQNRLNAAAFTEHELTFYTGEKIYLIESMKPNTGWRVLGQALFNNVVHDVAEAHGLTDEQVTQNLTKTEENAFGAK